MQSQARSWKVPPKRLQSIVQELRGSALRLLATGLAASPRVSGARSEHWPSIKVALEGLGLPADAVSACKTWLLQVPALPAHVVPSRLGYLAKLINATVAFLLRLISQLAYFAFSLNARKARCITTERAAEGYISSES